MMIPSSRNLALILSGFFTPIVPLFNLMATRQANMARFEIDAHDSQTKRLGVLMYYCPVPGSHAVRTTLLCS